MAADSRNCISRSGMLASGQSLTSLNDVNVLTMQTDGNLVLKYNGQITWETNTSGNGNYLSMQADGSIAIYSAGGSVVHTIAQSNGGVFFIAQDDGNLVEYTGGDPLFSTQTNR